MDEQAEFDSITEGFGHSSGDHLTALNIFNAYNSRKFVLLIYTPSTEPIDPEIRRRWCTANFLNPEIMQEAWSLWRKLSGIMDGE